MKENIRIIEFQDGYGNNQRVVLSGRRKDRLNLICCDGFIASRKEIQILGSKANEGYHCKGIARKMNIPESTVKFNIHTLKHRNVSTKNGCPTLLSTTEITLMAEKRGLLHPDFLKWMERDFD